MQWYSPGEPVNVFPFRSLPSGVDFGSAFGSAAGRHGAERRIAEIRQIPVAS